MPAAQPTTEDDTTAGIETADVCTDSDLVAAARVVGRLARQLDTALSTVDLTMAQHRLLTLLSSRTEGASRLAEKLSVSRPSLTAVVDGLVARGLVERRPHDVDRRRIDHVLTQRGRKLLAAADVAAAARLGEIAKHLDAAGAQQALAGLGAWGAGLDAWREAKRTDRS